MCVRDPQIFLTGVLICCFEGSMYAFIFNWTPVLDGDPNNNNLGVGWVQVGDKNRLGKSHKEAHGGDVSRPRAGMHAINRRMKAAFQA